DAEVGQACGAVDTHQDVLGAHVAVHEPEWVAFFVVGTMRSREAFEHIEDDRQDEPRVTSTGRGAHELVQAATLHVLEYDVRLAFTAEIDHAHDVGVMHTTEYARLALERLESFGVAIEVRVQHLHRKQATKSGAPGQAAHVHAPHATALEAREHFV